MLPAPVVTVLIPVLNRPHRVAPLLDNLIATRRYAQIEPFFLCSPGDDDQLAAVRENEHRCLFTVVAWESGQGDYARKINEGVWLNDRADFYFLAADDLRFEPGWIERALATHIETDACVVGTNDLANSRVIAGHHSTHTLVCARYVECGTIDEPDSHKLLHEGYDHNFCDDEFVQTAIHRQTWAMAGDSHVQALHPNWGTAPEDDTYRKGLARFNEDRLLLQRRQPLWTLA